MCWLYPPLFLNFQGTFCFDLARWLIFLVSVKFSQSTKDFVLISLYVYSCPLNKLSLTFVGLLNPNLTRFLYKQMINSHYGSDNLSRVPLVFFSSLYYVESVVCDTRCRIHVAYSVIQLLSLQYTYTETVKLSQKGISQLLNADPYQLCLEWWCPGTESSGKYGGESPPSATQHCPLDLEVWGGST